jgi:hypothetical protein
MLYHVVWLGWQERVLLRSSVDGSAVILLPVVEELVRRAKDGLRGNEDMLHHVVWSRIMDSPTAWEESWGTIGRLYRSSSWKNCGYNWIVYPPHPLAIGTNTYDLPFSTMYITWSRNAVRHIDVFRKYGTEIDRGIFLGMAIEDETAREELSGYDIIDADGRVNTFVYGMENDEYDLFDCLAREYGRTVAEALNVHILSNRLHLPPGLCFVTASRELSWELLHILTERGVVDTPEVLYKPTADCREVRRLVSFCITERSLATAVAPTRDLSSVSGLAPDCVGV